MTEFTALLTAIPGWMVILALVGVLLLAGEVLILLFALLRPLARRMGQAEKISVGITGANIELPDKDEGAGK
jgi:hypothetical protein